MCSMTGVPATGTSGLGYWLVSGRRREPSPPAMTTALMPEPASVEFIVASIIRGEPVTGRRAPSAGER